MRRFIFVAALSIWTLGLAQSPAAEPSGASATIRVTLPADAVLTVDGHATQATSETRRFTTPALQPGKRYYYNFKASFVRDGRTITVEKKVLVRAGQESAVSLGLPTAAVASANRNYYYDPQPATPTNTPAYSPPSFGGITIPLTSEWTPGGYQIYNP